MITILLAEDNDDVRDMITVHLQKRGFPVIAASDGLEAVIQTAQFAPALILMDIYMPELDGVEATVQIRAVDPEYRIPVIAITAHALPSDAARAKAAACNAFHAKSVDFEKLFAQITELIGEEAEGGMGQPPT